LPEASVSYSVIPTSIVTESFRIHTFSESLRVYTLFSLSELNKNDNYFEVAEGHSHMVGIRTILLLVDLVGTLGTRCFLTLTKLSPVFIDFILKSCILYIKTTEEKFLKFVMVD